MINAAARGAISTLVNAVTSQSDQSRALPLLELLGEFVGKASQSGL